MDKKSFTMMNADEKFSVAWLLLFYGNGEKDIRRNKIRLELIVCCSCFIRSDNFMLDICYERKSRYAGSGNLMKVSVEGSKKKT